MKTMIKVVGAAILVAVLFNLGCAKKRPVLWQSTKNPEVTAQLKSFIAEKEAQANAATNKMPTGVQNIFRGSQ